MSPSQLSITLTASVLALAMILGAATKCTKDGYKAIGACIETTGKPLECRAAMGYPAQ